MGEDENVDEPKPPDTYELKITASGTVDQGTATEGESE